MDFVRLRWVFFQGGELVVYKKVLNNLSVVFSSILIMSCSTPSNKSCYYRSSTDSNLVASPSAVVYSALNIVIYTPEDMPTEPFEIITTIKIPLYNEYGIKRQEARVNQMLKEQARSLGGNALILTPCGNTKHAEAQVIRFSPPPAKIAKNEGSLTSTSGTNQASATK